MTMSTAVKAILTLVVIVTVVGVFVSLSDPVVRVLLGLSDPGELDDSIKDEYIYQRQINRETINSINALLFSINTLAYYDTNLDSQPERDAFLDQMFSDTQERQFGNQIVKYTFSNVEPVFIEQFASDTGKAEMIESLLRCYYMFEDNGKKKTRCFEVELDSSIDVDALIDYKDEYKESYCPDEDCEELVDLLFKRDAKRVETDGHVGNEFYMCAEAAAAHISHLFADRIYLTDSLDHHSCRKDATDDDVLGMKVTNFYMKQDVGPIGDVRSFVQGYKPNILYYQVADPAITQDFEAAIFTFNLWDVIKWELIGSAMFDFVPALKPMRKLAGSVIKSTGQEILQQTGQETTEELGEIYFKQLFNNLGDSLSRARGIGEVYNTVKQAIEKTSEIFTRVKSLPGDVISSAVRGLVSEGGETATERAIRIMSFKGQLRRSFEVENIFQGQILDRLLAIEGVERTTAEFGEEFFSELTTESYEKIARGETGELTEQELESVFREVFGDYEDELGDDFYDVLRQQTAGFTDQYNEEVAQRFSGEIGAEMAQRIRTNERIWSKFQQRMERLFGVGISREEQQLVLFELLEESPDTVFGEMLDSPNDMRRFLNSYDLDLKTFEEMGLISAEEIDILVSQIDQLPLNVKFGAAMDRQLASKGGYLGIRDNPLKKKRTYVLLGLWYLSAKEVSDTEIFHSVGVNGFGFKTALSTPAIFDDYLTESWRFPVDKGKYEEYFMHYGASVIPGESDSTGGVPETDEELSYQEEVYLTEKYSGTIPEVYRYFISLSKDKRRFWFDQPNDRFYLIAPCKADVNVKITQEKCYSSPHQADVDDNIIQRLFGKETRYVTGEFNPLLDKTIDHFDGVNPSLYVVDENKDIIKVCDKKNLWEKVNPFDRPYTPTSISVDPILDRNLEMNYCYEGIDEQMMMANLMLNYGVPIAGGLIGGALCAEAPVCVFFSGAISGAVGGVTYMALETGAADKVPGLGPLLEAMGIQTKGYHWPYHNSRGY